MKGSPAATTLGISEEKVFRMILKRISQMGLK